MPSFNLPAQDPPRMPDDLQSVKKQLAEEYRKQAQQEQTARLTQQLSKRELN